MQNFIATSQGFSPHKWSCPNFADSAFCGLWLWVLETLQP